VLHLLAGLFVLAWLPGAVVFRLPGADRLRRAFLPAEERAFWAVVISVAWSCSAGLALAAGGVYTFGRLIGVTLVATFLVALAARFRLRLGAEAAPPTAAALIPLALLALGGWLFFPPSEYVIGGKDPGAYLNQGIQIAQRGSLIVRDPVVAGVPPGARDLFYPSHDQPAYYGTRFMGFFILDPDTGAVVGQFPHLYPVSIAIGYGLDGLTGARRTIGVWALLGLLAVYFTGARLIGRPAAAAGTALLALNVAQVWFARYPNSDLPMQALLFSGLLAFARAHTDEDRFFAPIGGVLLGLLLFIRIEAVLALAGVGLAVAVGTLRNRWPHPWFLGTLALTSAAAGVYLVGWMTPYLTYPGMFLSNLRPGHRAGIALGLAGLAALIVIAWRSTRPAGRPTATGLARRAADAVPTVLLTVVLSAAAYAFFLRRAGGALAPHDADAFRTFAYFYLTPAGLVAALAGYVLVVRRSFWRDPALLLTLAVFAFFFFYKVRIVPEHFWMARRFLTLILPASLLLVGAVAFAWIDDWRGRRVWRPIVGIAFVVVLGWQFFTASQPLLRHVEYAGIIPRLESLAARFGDDDLVIVESRNASDIHVLALPLAYIYARNVLVLNSPAPDTAMFAEFLAWAGARYREVFFIGGGGTDLLSRSFGVAAVDSDRFPVPEYASPRNAYPQGVRHKEFDFGIYRFIEARGEPTSFALDLGTMDDVHVRRFHAKERLGDRPFRWTRDVSYISVITGPGHDRLVTLWMSDGGRPPGAGPATVTVALDDRLLGTVTVGSGFAAYNFEVPAAVAEAARRGDAPARLRLVSSTWSPRERLGVGDDRQLGVMVDRVEVR
jgi:4-amino-4-deoxy-L-arabinose transferase-like glycosyltransferase